MKYSLLLAASVMTFGTSAMAESDGSISHGTPPFVAGVIGVFNAGVWAIDVNRNHLWDPGTNGFDEVHYFGTAGDQPVVFYGVPCFQNTQTAGIGTTRGNTWYASYNNIFDWDVAGDNGNTFTFGTSPFIPVTWNGVPATYSGGSFLIDWNGNHRKDSADVTLPFGTAGQIPVIGAWATTSGGTRIGTFDPSNRKWYVDADGSNTWSNGDATWTFGVNSSDYPVVMPYEDGVDHIGVFNGGSWYMDKNGNHVWDGVAGGDELWSFGSAGDTPVVARAPSWNGWCPID